MAGSLQSNFYVRFFMVFLGIFKSLRNVPVLLRQDEVLYLNFKDGKCVRRIIPLRRMK